MTHLLSKFMQRYIDLVLQSLLGEKIRGYLSDETKLYGRR